MAIPGLIRARPIFSHRAALILLAILLPGRLAGAADPAAAPQPRAALAENTVAAGARGDARLRAVMFVDPQRGWAVGDAGVIWHTADGGEHWEQQASGVECRLNSVQFIDADHGWAAGGFTQPYTHLTTGVLLRTTDGGQHWSRDEKLLLPALEKVQFFGPAHGWAIGRPSALYPSGIFVTESGGREWSPIPASDSADWTAADFTGRSSGSAVARDGSVALLRGTESIAANSPTLGLASARGIKFASRDSGWLVGDGGLILATTDGGQNWRPPAGQIPADVARQLDFRAVAVRGPHVWIAGTPGTIVFHSTDGGKSWDARTTGQSLPIEAIAFADEQHGWAVGALGTILATGDGGLTWRRERGGGDRVALMGIFSDPLEVPLELFARVSASDGFLSTVELLNRRDLEGRDPAALTLTDRADEALATLGSQGAETGWQFPLRQRGLDLPVLKTLAIWDQASDGHGLDALEARMVRQIRVWRPDVVIVSDVEAAHDDPVRQLIQRVVLRAVEHAADPADNADQPARLGAWPVKRVYAALPPGQSGAVNIATGQLATRLGQSLAEIAWQPRGILYDQYATAPDVLGFRLLQGRGPQDTGQADFFGGLDLVPGGKARRPLAQPSGESLEVLRRLAVQRRNLQALLKHTPEASNQWLAQVGRLTEGLDESSAGEILFQLGWQAYRAGQWEAAAQAFELLTAQYPHHRLAPAAQVWQVQYEAGVGGRGSGVGDRGEGRGARGEGTVVLASGELPGTAPAPGVDEKSPRPPAPSGPNVEAAANDPRATRAVQLAEQIERTDPAPFAEPAIRFPLAAAYRRLGMSHEAERALASLRFGPHSAWWSCAEGENWLAQPHGPPPKSVWRCAVAAKRPTLDGKLDDAVWKAADPVELHSAEHDDAAWPAAAMLAHDQQFLYLAVRCRQSPESDYPPADGPRPRSADLSRRDHVDLLLSPDRDYATWYRLSIDYRGWVNTACWGDESWHPTLYVAAATSENTWIVEAAIPFSELAAAPSAEPGSHRRPPWSVNIQRTIPGVGFQSWSLPATIEGQPEGFGFLEFE